MIQPTPPDDIRRDKTETATKLLELDPATVHTPLGNRALDPADMADLLASMSDIGQQTFGQVRKHPTIPGHWEAVAGNRRLYCCRVLGRKFLATEVPGDVSEADVIKLRLTENVLRKSMQPLEIAQDVLRFMQLTGVSQAEAATKLNLNPATVSKALKVFSKLAEDLHPLVLNFTLGPSVAYLISDLEHDDQRSVVKKAIDEKLGRDAVQTLVDAIRMKGKPKKAKPITVEGKLDGRPFKLTLRADDTLEMLAEALKTLAGKLTRHKEVPVSNAGFLFS